MLNIYDNQADKRITIETLIGGEAYDRYKLLNNSYIHIILWTTWNDYHSNCLSYCISNNYEQKRIDQKQLK